MKGFLKFSGAVFIIAAVLSLIGGFYFSTTVGSLVPGAGTIYVIAGVFTGLILCAISAIPYGIIYLIERQEVAASIAVKSDKSSPYAGAIKPKQTVETTAPDRWTCECGTKVRGSVTCPACGKERPAV